MSRQQLEDEIHYQRRYLKSLEETKTDCHHCAKLRYKTTECMKHGAVPVEFMARSDCPDWEYQTVPF